MLRSACFWGSIEGQDRCKGDRCAERSPVQFILNIFKHDETPWNICNVYFVISTYVQPILVLPAAYLPFFSVDCRSQTFQHLLQASGSLRRQEESTESTESTETGAGQLMRLGCLLVTCSPPTTSFISICSIMTSRNANIAHCKPFLNHLLGTLVGTNVCPFEFWKLWGPLASFRGVCWAIWDF